MNGAIDVTGVLKHPDLVLEFLVDPLRSLLLRIIDDFSLSKVPRLDIIGCAWLCAPHIFS